MLFTENHSAREFALTDTELRALELAQECGWLTLTREIGEHALACWQHDCARFGRAFAVVREEPTRASIWFVLTSGREWTSEDQGRVRAALAASTGFILTENQARAFASRGSETALMQRLLAANALGQ
jgi:hypothetical protein